MANDILSTSKVRFDISNEGWARMNAGRSASVLIREAVANAFDADDVTQIKVNLHPGFASIEDNSAVGVGDPSLITTVFLTGKADSHIKRGRKGRGLKELLAVAETATVDTVGTKIEFADGRKVMTSDRTVGTKVSVNVPDWGQEQIDGAVAYLLKMIVPPGISLSVNGIEVKKRQLVTSFNSTLETQIVEEGIQRNRYNPTAVHIVALDATETEGWIYEMGIPVQAVKTRFHINIQQRVPLNDNRDIVDSYYLNSLYGNILDNCIISMDKDTLKEEWTALGMSYAKLPTHRVFVTKMFGDISGLVVKSKNSRANDIAKQHGFSILDTEGMTNSVDRVVANIVPSADTVVERIEASEVDQNLDPAVVDPSGRITAFTRYLGLQLLMLDLEVKFFDKGPSFTGFTKLADFDINNKVIRFNIRGELWGKDPITPKMFSVICHEFAHAVSAEHDAAFNAEVQRLTGKLAMLMLNRRDDVYYVAGVKSLQATTGKLVINCVECGAPREIFPQDAHQVKKCGLCTRRARTQRAKNKRAEPRS